MASNDEKFILRPECEEVKKTVFGKFDEMKGTLCRIEKAIVERNNRDARKEGYNEGVIDSQAGKDKAMTRKLKLYVAIAAICSPIVMKIIEAVTEALKK